MGFRQVPLTITHQNTKYHVPTNAKPDPKIISDPGDTIGVQNTQIFVQEYLNGRKWGQSDETSSGNGYYHTKTMSQWTGPTSDGNGCNHADFIQAQAYEEGRYALIEETSFLRINAKVFIVHDAQNQSQANG